ncbi:uncharacterized protein EV420DRAFT_1580311 [Desarmillaria tabescens]|uniref:Mug135-like C-terminal domain-containing protein n=1 Tax=Armillaria tabescens TaxID=1929756 RepID=A0AA39JH46_ARMTA|nr:uncharacterized protein EV420DRAFT_1580311 [Desarmillaria tabescens]KAK0441219.1 hypothetical protein EV420DRAFT_1580311 [Desarmillaria tabescens]
MAYYASRVSPRSNAPPPNYDEYYRNALSYAEGTDYYGSVGNEHLLGVPIYEHKLETRVIDQQDMLDLLKAQKAEVFASIASLAHVVHQRTNNYRFTGEAIPFEIIPFVNGAMPNELPHLHPALTSVHVINALTPEQLIRYCSGYELAHDPRNIDLMIVDLKAHIGCEASS